MCYTLFMRKFFSHTYFIYLLVWLVILWSLDLFARKYSLYYTFHYFDKVLHLIGGISLGLFASIVQDSFYPKTGRSVITKAKVIIGFAVVFGGFWELKEFISNNIGTGIPFDAFDTTTDLICDTLGGFLSFIYLTYFKNHD